MGVSDMGFSTDIYLDNAATARKYPAAIKAEADFYKEINANPLRGLYKKSVQATTGVEAARKAILALVRADKSYTVIFSRGTTEAINLVANGLVKGPDGFGIIGREAKVISDIESHHSNILPWRQRFENYILSRDLEEDTKGAVVISLTGVSNVTGEYFGERIKNMRKRHSKAILGVDGAQMVGHVDFDIKALGADFVAFSGHKFGAPMGVGGLIIKNTLAEKLRPLNFGGEMVDSVAVDGTPTFAEIPERLEAGTLSAGAIFGLKRAAELALDEFEHSGLEREKFYQNIQSAAAEMRKIEHVQVLAANGLIITFQIDGVHPHDVAQILADEGIMVRAGWLCAEPYLRYKGWGPVVRASFSMLNVNECEKYSTFLVEAVRKVRKKMGL